MATQYARYTRPDGDEAVLLADPLSRGRYERKGFTYVGPVEQSPGLEPANPGRDGGLTGAVADMDATEIVRQATDVVTRKLAGTWTEQEAVDESKLIRGKMYELGSFPIAGLDAPSDEGSTAQAQTGPYPTPVVPQPGAAVTVTGDQASPEQALAGVTTGADGATGVATDGAASGATGNGAPDLSGTPSATQVVTTAGSPGSFSGGTTPSVKADLEATKPEPTTPWTEGQYVRVGNYDWYWDGTKWVQGKAPVAATA